MTKQDAIKKVDEIIAARGGVVRKILLTRYHNFHDWHLPSEDGPATELDFIEARSATDAVAEEMTRRGIEVRSVMFDRSSYARWLGARQDTRNARSQWATTVENRLTFSFVISHDSIGWAVLENN